MGVMQTSVFSNMVSFLIKQASISPIRHHLDLDDSAPSLNTASQVKKSASAQQADVLTNFNLI